MTWQESLRQLDARLANGEIGAADYRKERDEILAEASSGAGGATPKTDLWTSTNPVRVVPAPAPNGTSGPPPVQPSVQPGEPGDPATDQTVTIERVTGEEPTARTEQPDADTTQVVEETTQVVSSEVVGQQVPQPGQYPPMNPDAFGTPFPRSTPIQGQEVFAGASSKGGGLALRILVPLLIVALVGAGVWWFVLRDDGSSDAAPNGAPPASGTEPPATTTTTAPTTTTTTSEAPKVPTVAELAGKLPTLPGAAKAGNGPVTIDQAVKQGKLNQPYAQLLREHGASKVVYLKSTAGGVGYQLVAAPIEKSGGADATATAVSDGLKQTGFAAAKARKATDPPVLTRKDKYFRTYLTTYASGGVWIQLNVSGPPNGGEAALRAKFADVLDALTEQLPAP